MNSTLQIGPFVLQTQGLVIILSALLGYYSLNFRLKRIDGIKDSEKSRIVETIEIAAILAIVIWKFSLILFDPVRVLTYPTSLLYFSGGERGIGLSVIAAVTYIYYHSKKETHSILLYANLLAAGYLVGMGIYSWVAIFENLNKAWVYGSEVVIAILLYQQHFRKSKEIASFENLNQSLLWFSLGQIFISFFNPLKQNYWWGFSKLQLVFLSLAVLCIVFDFVVANRKKEVI
ncbi:hypothetical protein [Desulfitobacterium metallireducens]|uniref:Prolipoprotein diacylglyceryl transferase n=1 Tax=Desulfitobacterium metallireducens DSM 15288 TaxID=871968 RepID=W0EG59_9FIRM|nr:hypothetical protein [Desulfitobacterium metallireducens]AHF08508.1 hypothetical protein DESME_05560 [Desulfitobacterium metallireducens DSM 15288]